MKKQSPKKYGAYIRFATTTIYSSPQYDFFGRNTGLPFFNVTSLKLGAAVKQRPNYADSGGLI